MVFFWNDPDFFVVDRFNFEYFNKLNRYHSGNYRRAYDPIHVKALQAEHLLYSEPRYYFSFDDYNPK